jgi:isopentenyl phosphate kinase
MKLVKLGGSAITNKKEAGSGRGVGPRFLARVAGRLLREIRDSGERVIIVTGAGPFGHVKARKHALSGGYGEDSQWDGFVDVSRDVRRLNLMVLDEGLRLGMRLVSVPPSVSVLMADGRIHYIDEGVFRRYLSAGLTPVTFGDVALDTSRRFSICGGDALMERLAAAFSADMAVFVSDVDGIRVGPEGRTAHEFAAQDMARITPVRGLGGQDVTGGIAEKARLALSMAAAGTEVVVLNGKKKGRLLEALKGGKPDGTWFRRP